MKNPKSTARRNTIKNKGPAPKSRGDYLHRPGQVRSYPGRIASGGLICKYVAEGLFLNIHEILLMGPCFFSLLSTSAYEKLEAETNSLLSM